MSFQPTPAQLEFNRARKERMSRLSAAASKARRAQARMVALRKQDAILEVIERAKALPMPAPRERDILNVGRGFKFKYEPAIAEIQRLIAQHHGFTLDELRGPRRMKPLSRARQVAVFCVWALKPSVSLPEIGRRTGNRDHSTIWHAVRKLSAEYKAPTRLEAHIAAKNILRDAGYIWPQPKPDGEGEGE